MELSIINETKKIIEEFNNEINKNNEKYYQDVLDFLNLLFNQNCNQILKISISKISLSDDIFEFYNKIIEKYKINIRKFDNDKFNSNEIYTFHEIIEIALIMSNNLLDKINYKIIKINNDKTKYKIIITN
jgi:hypothetical protein